MAEELDKALCISPAYQVSLSHPVATVKASASAVTGGMPQATVRVKIRKEVV